MAPGPADFRALTRSALALPVLGADCALPRISGQSAASAAEDGSSGGGPPGVSLDVEARVVVDVEPQDGDRTHTAFTNRIHEVGPLR